jgi:hypothetical protein
MGPRVKPADDAVPSGSDLHAAEKRLSKDLAKIPTLPAA